MMFKNQLQELAQRSCFNLPSYTSTREGPDHAPRFKASVNFNGEIFDSPSYCTTLRQAEHAAAEVALNALSSSGPSRSLTARVLVGLILLPSWFWFWNLSVCYLLILLFILCHYRMRREFIRTSYRRQPIELVSVFLYIPL